MLHFHHYLVLENASGSRHATAPLKIARDMLMAAAQASASAKPVPSFLCGAAGTLALTAITSYWSGDYHAKDQAIAMLASFATSPVSIRAS